MDISDLLESYAAAEQQESTLWLTGVLVGFALGLGFAYLKAFHGSMKAKSRSEKWKVFAVWAAFGVFIIGGLGGGIAGVLDDSQQEEMDAAAYAETRTAIQDRLREGYGIEVSAEDVEKAWTAEDNARVEFAVAYEGLEFPLELSIQEGEGMAVLYQYDAPLVPLA